jgi:hypothetical protein
MKKPMESVNDLIHEVNLRTLWWAISIFAVSYFLTSKFFLLPILIHFSFFLLLLDLIYFALLLLDASLGSLPILMND